MNIFIVFIYSFSSDFIKLYILLSYYLIPGVKIEFPPYWKSLYLLYTVYVDFNPVRRFWPSVYYKNYIKSQIYEYLAVYYTTVNMHASGRDEISEYSLIRSVDLHCSSIHYRVSGPCEHEFWWNYWRRAKRSPHILGKGTGQRNKTARKRRLVSQMPTGTLVLQTICQCSLYL